MNDVKLKWTEVQSCGDFPMKRSGHSCEVFPSMNKMILFGGNDRMRDYHVYEFDTRQWTRKVAPIATEHHSSSMVLKGTKILIYLFGGRESKSQRHNQSREPSDVNSIFYEVEILEDEEIWSAVETTGKSPGNRMGHTCVVLRDRYLIIFGGWLESLAYTDEMFQYDIDERKWEQIVPSSTMNPCKRSYHSAVMIQERNKMIVCCGISGKKHNDFWEFDFSTKRWKELKIENKELIIPRACQCALLLEKNSNLGGGHRMRMTDRLILGPGDYENSWDEKYQGDEKASNLFEIDLVKNSCKMIPCDNHYMFNCYSLFQYRNELFLCGGEMMNLQKKKKNEGKEDEQNGEEEDDVDSWKGGFENNWKPNDSLFKISCPSYFTSLDDSDLRERLEYMKSYMDENDQIEKVEVRILNDSFFDITKALM